VREHLEDHSKKFLKHELIGLRVEVVESNNKFLKGISGTVVYETMKMIFIRTKSGAIKKVPKSICVFRFTLPDGTVLRVNGEVLYGRPEDRIKKRLKYW